MDDQEQRLKPLRDEANALLYVLHDLDVLDSYRAIPPQTSGFMRNRYRARLDSVYGQAAIPISAQQRQVPRFAPPPAASPAKAPSPSLKHLAADNAILLVSSIGGALLILAALLFELYGASSFGQWARFAVVAGVTAIFGCAARFAWQRDALRIVGKTYLAVFALLVPITLTAAYEFLPLRQWGMTPDVTAALGGAGCALLYGLLGSKIASREYTLMGVLAGLAGWTALLHATAAGNWWGTGICAAAVVVSGFARLPERSPFRRMMEPFGTGLSVITFVFGSLMTINTANFTSAGVPQAPWLPVTAGLGLLAVVVRPGFIHDVSKVLLASAAVTIAALTTCYTVDAGLGAYALAALAIGVCFTAMASLAATPDSTQRLLMRLGWAHLFMAIVLPYDGNQLHAVVGVAGVLAACLPIVVGRESRFSFVPAALFAIAWYWIVPAIITPPAHAGASTLALAYTPLAFILAGAGAALRILVSREWSRPVELVAAATAAFTLLLAVSSGDQTLATIDLFGFGLLVYAASWWEDQAAGTGASALLVGLGAASQLNVVHASIWALPLIWSLLAFVYYVSASFFPNDTSWNRAHRFAGIAVSVAAAVVPALQLGQDGWSADADIAELLAALVLAGLVMAESRLDVAKPAFWVSVGIAVLALDWIPAALSASNPQAYTAIPGIVATLAGWALMQRDREWLSATAAGALAAAGVAMMLGVTVLQSFSDDPAAATYAAVGVAEAAAMILAGIAVAHRATVTAAGGALALLGMHGLYQVVQEVPLYAVFATAAAVLIAVGALMATSRARVEHLRNTATRNWSSWH